MAGKLVIILLVILGVFLRTYQFPERINFGMEQGMTLSMTASYIHEKFSLLGMSNVARVTHDGHMVLINPLYNYSLIPFMLVLGKNPITLSYLALWINLLTALVLYYVAQKVFNKRTAIFSSFFFLFNLTMIEHSLTLWIHNLVPLVGILSFYLLVKWQSNRSWAIVFVLGILSGLGYAMEYIYLLTAGLIALYLFATSKSKISTIFWYTLGFAIPQLPVIIFDLRHEWYNIKTLWQYTLDTIEKPSQSRLAFYHFLQYYPIVFLFMGYITAHIYKLNKVVVGSILLIYLSFTLTSPKLSLNQAVGTPTGMNTPMLLDLASSIAKDAQGDFNVVYLPQSEYRAHALRYMLTYIYGVTPMGVEAYPSAKTIYAVGDTGLDLLKDRPWEVGAFNPRNQVVLTMTPNNLFSVYKLTQ